VDGGLHTRDLSGIPTRPSSDDRYAGVHGA
jgi:hypothetical protein